MFKMSGPRVAAMFLVSFSREKTTGFYLHSTLKEMRLGVEDTKPPRSEESVVIEPRFEPRHSFRTRVSPLSWCHLTSLRDERAWSTLRKLEDGRTQDGFTESSTRQLLPCRSQEQIPDRLARLA